MSKRHHSGFGIIVQGIIGAAQAIALGSGKAHEYSTVKRYLRKEEHTQQLEAQTQRELKEKELAAREQLLQKSAATKLFEDQQLKKVVIVGGAVAIAITIFTFAILLMLSGKDDEYE